MCGHCCRDLYCDTECQRLAWERHKIYCKTEYVRLKWDTRLFVNAYGDDDLSHRQKCARECFYIALNTKIGARCKNCYKTNGAGDLRATYSGVQCVECIEIQLEEVSKCCSV